jgi:replication factor C subunit 3/5
MLWVDKYRPHTFADFTLNQHHASSMEKLLAKGASQSASASCFFRDAEAHCPTPTDAGDFPHILLYGPPGSGKKTLMKALIREFYGSGVTKVKIETKPWKIELPSRKLEIELMTLSSNYHVEMNPSDVGNNDRCAEFCSRRSPAA